MTTLYVAVVKVDKKWAENQTWADMKDFLEQTFKNAIGFRGKIVGSELVSEPNTRSPLRDRERQFR